VEQIVQRDIHHRRHYMMAVLCRWWQSAWNSAERRPDENRWLRESQEAPHGGATGCLRGFRHRKNRIAGAVGHLAGFFQRWR